MMMMMMMMMIMMMCIKCSAPNVESTFIPELPFSECVINGSASNHFFLCEKSSLEQYMMIVSVQKL